MKTMRSLVFVYLVTVSAAWSVTPLQNRSIAAQQAPVLAVIVSPRLQIRDISFAMLKRTFKGDIAELGGVRLIPFNFGTNDPMRNEFDRLVLGFRPHEIGAYWVDRRIRGQGLPPRSVPDVRTMKGVVANLASAIGYVPSSQLDSTVSALTVDGISIKQTNYPLR